MFKEKLFDILFGLFYIILFSLQALPGLAVVLFGVNTAMFWIMCAVGACALVIQAIKFPCVMVRFWNVGMIGMLILSLVLW